MLVSSLICKQKLGKVCGQEIIGVGVEKYVMKSPWIVHCSHKV